MVGREISRNLARPRGTRPRSRARPRGEGSRRERAKGEDIRAERSVSDNEQTVLFVGHKGNAESGRARHEGVDVDERVDANSGAHLSIAEVHLFAFEGRGGRSLAGVAAFLKCKRVECFG
jgi:hypothetical protein